MNSKIEIAKVDGRQIEPFTVSFLEVVVMPSGEVISNGQTLGWMDKIGDNIWAAPENIQEFDDESDDDDTGGGTKVLANVT